MSAPVRPRTIHIAIAFFTATIILQIVAFIIDGQHLYSPAGQASIDQSLAEAPDDGELDQAVLRDIAQTTALVMIGIGALFNIIVTLLVIFLVLKGRAAGRIIATILSAASVIFVAATWEDFNPILDSAVVLAIVAAVVLLWHPQSTRFFHLRKAARRDDIYREDVYAA